MKEILKMTTNTAQNGPAGQMRSEDMQVQLDY